MRIINPKKALEKIEAGKKNDQTPPEKKSKERGSPFQSRYSIDPPPYERRVLRQRGKRRTKNTQNIFHDYHLKISARVCRPSLLMC
jgi:hypothetical protein